MSGEFECGKKAIEFYRKFITKVRIRLTWAPRPEGHFDPGTVHAVVIGIVTFEQGEQLQWRRVGAATGRRLPMKSLRTMWSSTDFGANELTRYASAVMCREARQGIFVLGILTMLLMAGLALLYHTLGLGTAYPYTFGVLALLALHVAVFPNSRGSGSSWISLARATRLLVSPLIAETTTTSLMPGGFE